MQSDDLVWQVINGNFCAFKVKTKVSTFCRNENNVTGLCNRQSCPLANSNYATVREHQGAIYLYKKTAERAHSPARMWEKILLEEDYEKAAAQIAQELEHWPKFLQAKCTLRMGKIKEYLKRLQRIEANPESQQVLTVRKDKVVRRERAREAKAHKAARIETTIEKELLERLQNGVYGDIYNLPQKAFEDVLSKHGQAQELEESEEGEEDYEFVEDEDEEEDDVEFEPSEGEEIEDVEDIIPARKRAAQYVEIEYDNHDSDQQRRRELTK